VRFHRLHPDCAEVDAAEQFDALRPQELAPADRPYVLCNFIVTADGRAAFHGRSGPLGDEGDKEVFHRLRTLVDAVLVGTGTLRAERYGKLVRRPERVAERERRGLAPNPLAVLVSRSGDLPAAPMFDDADQEIVAYVGARSPLDGAAATVRLHDLEDGALRPALEHLRERHGVRAVLCEGGPTLTSALLADDLVDELFLTVAPVLAGGGNDPSMTTGPPLPELRPMRLEWVLEREAYLFLRYRLTRER